jgi:hypothetical protein
MFSVDWLQIRAYCFRAAAVVCYPRSQKNRDLGTHSFDED